MATRPARWYDHRVPTLADALRVVNGLEKDGVVSAYAVGGAMAMLFWAEPTVTFDLDVFVLLPGNVEGPIVSLEPIYRVLRARGCEVVAEHVVIHGTPVQFLVSPNALADEAIGTAARQELDGVPFARVLDESRLAELLRRYGVTSS